MDDTESQFILVSNTGTQFKILKSLINKSKMIENAMFLDKTATSMPIYLDDDVLHIITKWLHLNPKIYASFIPQPIPDSNLNSFMDRDNSYFFKSMTLRDLKKTIFSSDYLALDPLLEMSAATMAAIIRSKPKEYIKKVVSTEEYDSHLVKDLT